MMLPTGTGGVLYRTSFFDDVIFDGNFRLATVSTDDITFRLATMIKEVNITISCIPGIDQSRGAVSHRFKCGHGYLKKANFSLPQYPQLDIFQRSVKVPRLKKLKLKRNAERPEPAELELAVGGKSLYDAVNNNGGNEEQWTAGVRFLTKANKQVLPLISKYLAIERQRECISAKANFYERLNFTEGDSALGLSFCC